LLRRVPERSNSDAITEQVIHGNELWESNHCMGCHTLLGEGP
jgi:nitric oxide reductase subunit C